MVIYVIDNGSTDHSLDFLRAHYPHVQIIANGNNAGFAEGYNLGIERIPEPYVLMINSDVEVTPGFLEPLVALLEANPDMAVVQPKILSFSNRDMLEHAGAAGGLMDRYGYAFCRGRIFDHAEPDRNQYPTAEIFWASGACCLLRKAAYGQVGGMYAYLFMHFEEIDLCWRLQAEGYRIFFCNEAQVYHVGGGSLSYGSPRKTFLNFRNNLVMVYRNSTWAYKWWWLPFRFVLDMVAALKFLTEKNTVHARAVIKAYGAFIQWIFTRNKPKLQRKLLLTGNPNVFKGSVVWQYFIRHRKPS